LSFLAIIFTGPQKCCRLSIYDVDRKAILQRKHAISLIEFGDPGGMLEGVAI
jgi:hypothetical protein